VEGQGEFPSLVSSSIIWEWERKGGRGTDEGYGKWVELEDLPTLHHPRISVFSSGKVILRL